MIQFLAVWWNIESVNQPDEVVNLWIFIVGLQLSGCRPHTSSVWPWSGALKVCLYDTFLGSLRQSFAFRIPSSQDRTWPTLINYLGRLKPIGRHSMWSATAGLLPILRSWPNWQRRPTLSPKCEGSTLTLVKLLIRTLHLVNLNTDQGCANTHELPMLHAPWGYHWHHQPQCNSSYLWQRVP